MNTPPDTDRPDDSISDDTTLGRFPRWLKWALFGALAILIVGYGLIFLYAKVLNDSPDELGESDLATALSGEPTSEGTNETLDPAETAPTEATDAPATGNTPAGTPAPVDEATALPGSDPWNITSESELGYRVKEILFGVDAEGVGRTNQITGALTVADTQVTEAEFVVDMATIESDDSRRDNQFHGRIMSTDEFPTATFTLTEPIELGTAAVEGATVETRATGELMLRGVTNTVTFDVSARLENGKIGVLGSIPVIFADYGVANPSTAAITTEDNGLLEFVLVFEPAA